MADVVTLEASLKLLDEVSPSLENIEKAMQGFESALGVTRKELEAAEQAHADLAKEITMVELAANALGLTMEEYGEILQNKVVQAIAAAQDAAHDFNDEFNRAADMAKDVDAAFDAMHIEALKEDLERAAKAAKDAVGPFENLARALISGSFDDVFNAAKKIPAAFGISTKAVYELADSVEKLAERGQMLTNKSIISGIDVEKLQQFERAAQLAGGSLDQLTRATTMLGRTMDGNKDIFKRMGIDIKDLKAKDSAGQLEFLAKKLFDIKNPAERSTAAMALFGRGAAQMLPTLKALAEGAGELKVALSGEQVAALDALDQSIGQAKGSFSDLKEQLVAIVATSPAVKAAIDFIGNGIRDLANWVKTDLSPALTVLQGRWAEIMGMMSAKERETNTKIIADLDKLIKQGKTVNDVYSGLGVGTLVEFGTETGRVINETKLAGETLEQTRDKLKKHNEELDKTTASQMKLGEAMISGDPITAATAAATGDLTDKLTAAQKAHLKLIEQMAKGLGGEKAQKTANDLAEAIKKLGGFSEVVDKTGLAKQLAELEDASAKLPPELHEMAQAYRDMSDAGKQADKNLKDLREEAQAQEGMWTAMAAEIMDAKQRLDELTGKIDLKKFYELRETLEQLPGADAFGQGGDISGIPTAKIKELAEFYEKAAKQGEILSEVEQKIVDKGQQMNGVTAAHAMAQAQVAKWGQLFQGLIGLAGMFGETAAAAAQIAGNTFDQFAAAGEKARSANAMESGGSELFAKGGLGGLQDKLKLGKGLSTAEMKDFDKATEQAAAKTAKFNAGINAGAAVAGMLGDKLQKSTNPSVQKLGGALSGAAAGAKMGAAFGPWGAAVGAIGGAVLGFIGKAKKMREEMKKLKAAFLDSHGGMEKLAEEAKAAGVNIDKAMKSKTPEAMKKAIEDAEKQMAAFKELTDMAGGSLEALKGKAADAGISLQAIWDAKTPEEYLKATEAVKKSLGDWDKANEKLNAAMDKYGISVDQLGPKFRQAGLDKIGLGLLESFSLLKAAGVDVGLITEKMSADMSDYVNRAVAAGSTVPQAMKPMIEEMIKNGDLLDENGKAYDSLADSGITFAQTLEEGIASAVKAIEDLVAVLAQGFSIPVDVHPGGGAGAGSGGSGGKTFNPTEGRGKRGGDEEGFAGGSDGFRDFGTGTRAVLHGMEAVVRPMDLQSAMAEMMSQGSSQGAVTTNIQLAISENPMQTAETVEQMRSFTLETVEREVARSLADAIADGKA